MSKPDTDFFDFGETDAYLFADLVAPQEFPRFDLKMETEFQCPCCAYEWSGGQKPSVKEIDAETQEEE